jgi:hypothetical protein
VQPGADTDRALTAWGIGDERVRALRQAAIIG